MTNEEALKECVAKATTEELASLIWHDCTRCAFSKERSWRQGKCPNCSSGNYQWLLEETKN